MNISQKSITGFSGVKLINPTYEHAKYVKNVLNANGVYVAGHKTYRIENNFLSKRNIANYVRYRNNFCNDECGIIFFPWAQESWVISNKGFEQKIKKILDHCYIDSEINLGI